MSLTRTRLAIAIALVCGGALGLRGQELTPEQFAERSLQFRTALHYDPMLPQPLQSLVDLYGDSGRSDELVGLYRSHVEKYPNDAGAKAVLVQIMERTGRQETGEFLASAIALHPESSALNYLLFRFLDGKGDPRSAESLSRAIDLETNPARRGQWLDELLQISGDDTGRAFASEQLEKVIGNEVHEAPFLLDLAILAQRYGFWKESAKSLEKALDKGLDAEATIDAEVRLSKAKAELGDPEEAGTILDSILERLAPDHWRRREIMTTRVGVIASDEEREKIVGRFRKAYEADPENPASAIDYAEILVAGERRDEAAKVLEASSSHFSPGGAAEERALALMESIASPERYAGFLDALLDRNPDRNDLRLRSVKADFALNRDADASQDLRVVVAGLEEEEVPARLLELQRFLRGIDRIDAAKDFLERYVRDHPERLDLARELAEIYDRAGQRAAIDSLAEKLDPAEASVDSVADLAGYLLDEGAPLAARKLIDRRLSAGDPEFDLGLLQIRVLGRLGLESEASSALLAWRDSTDTPDRYSRWLDAAVEANEELQTLDRFFDNEQARFSFSNESWPADKVEKFVLLCEAGRQRMLGGRVADSIRGQLATGTFDSTLRVRLRRFLVDILGSDPASAVEVETQLRALAQEDPARATEYELRRALIYDATNRVDLSEQILVGMDLSRIDDADLVRSAMEVLVGYGFLDEAESALAAINSLAPEDIFAWEKRLSLLAFLGREADFRSVIRDIRSGSVGLELREDTLATLDQHLTGSYWRSIARNVAGGDLARLEETLPLLASVDRDARPTADSAWAEWTRAEVLRSLGRAEEASDAVERLRSLAASDKSDTVRFPDGLILDLTGALQAANSGQDVDSVSPTGDAGFLAGTPELAWAFQPDAGSRIERFGVSGTTVVVLDDRGSLYGVDSITGKVAWSLSPGSPQQATRFDAVGLFVAGDLDLAAIGGNGSAAGTISMVKRARAFGISRERVHVVVDDQLEARTVADGKIAWKAVPPFSTLPVSGDATRRGARPSLRIAVSDGFVVLFRPPDSSVAVFEESTGRLVWSENGGVPRSELISLNAGLDASNGLLFLYGSESSVRRIQSGETVWKFSAAGDLDFPPALRRDRQVDESPPTQTAQVVPAPDPLAAEKGRSKRVLFDFLSDNTMSDRSGSFFLMDSVGGTGATMVNPAVFWAENRFDEQSPAYARLAGEFLWLMSGNSVRRISLRLPASSTEMPADGIFIGVTGSHAWFSNRTELIHLDFATMRTQTIDCRDLGGPIRATLMGNQIVVRGLSGLKIANALTGTTLGSALWPEGLRELVSLGGRIESEGAEYLWHGVADAPSGGPRYCLPVDDRVDGERYFAKVADDILVCLVPRIAASAQTDEPAAPSAKAAGRR